MSLAHILAAAVNREQFITLCRSHVEASPLVEYCPELLVHIADDIRKTPPCGWDWYAPKSDDPFVIFFAHAFNAALNGGYFDFHPHQQGIAQWAVDGSGSRALELWIDNLKNNGMLPGTHFVNLTKEDVDGIYMPLLQWIPYAQERRDVCLEFSSAARMAALFSLLAQAGSNGVYRFELHHADALARIYPAAFGEDPFRKKAILAFTTFAGHLAARDIPVHCTLPIPADYQMPRIFQWLGVINAGPEITAALESKCLLQPLSPEVMTLRAAAALAAADLARLAGTDDFRVDTTLFTRYRVAPDFIRDAPPPMRCNSFWF